MGTPDALRLSRLDRLISQLGEHQLSIRQQGTSVTDLETRVQGLEKRVLDELASLWPLRELDVQAELTSAKTSNDKLSKQVALLGRDQEEGRIQAEKRMQQVEARQAEVEQHLAALACTVEAAAAEAGAGLDELRGATKAMLGEFVSRIADQFDALQAALEEAIGGRDKEAQERSAAAAAVQRSLEEQRAWVERRAEQMAAEVAAALEAGQAGAAAVADEQAQRSAAAVEEARRGVQQEVAALRSDLEAAQAQLAEQQGQQESLAEQVEVQGQKLAEAAAAQEAQGAAQAAAAAAAAEQAAAQAGLQQRVDALAEQQTAAVQGQGEAQGALREALTVWQRGLEGHMEALERRLSSQVATAAAQQQQLAGRFDEYKGYVKRLRREVAETRAEHEASTRQIGAVRHEFSAAHEKMDRVQAEAAALGSELLHTTTAAAAANSALRQLSLHP